MRFRLTMPFLLAFGLMATDAAAQDISIRHRGGDVAREERETADVSGAPNCASPTFRVRRSYATAPERGVVTASSQMDALMKALGYALASCRSIGPIVRVIDVSERPMMERRELPDEIDRYRTSEISAWLAGQNAVQPGARRPRRPQAIRDTGIRPEYLTTIAAPATALRETPMSDARAWRSRVSKLTRALKGAEPFAAATCDVSTFTEASLDTYFRVVSLQNTCAQMAEAFGIPAPASVTDPRLRREFDNKLGRIASHLFAPVQWIETNTPAVAAQMDAYVAKPNVQSTHVRNIVEALATAQSSPAVAALSQTLAARADTMAAAERVAAAEAAQANRIRREAEARAQRERQAAAALAAAAAKAAAEADKTARLRALRGGAGPSGYDVIAAIRAEHFRYSNYQPAGAFGLMQTTPLLPSLASAAREYDITRLACTSARAGYSCTYDLKRRWTTDQYDSSGFMAGLEALANAFGQGLTGRNLQDQTFTRTDTFQRVGGAWRSATWAEGLAEAERAAREARNCTTTRERSGTGFAVRGNRMLGAWPEYRVVTRC